MYQQKPSPHVHRVTRFCARSCLLVAWQQLSSRLPEQPHPSPEHQPIKDKSHDMITNHNESFLWDKQRETKGNNINKNIITWVQRRSQYLSHCARLWQGSQFCHTRMPHKDMRHIIQARVLAVALLSVKAKCQFNYLFISP